MFTLPFGYRKQGAGALPQFHALTPDPLTHAMRGVLLGAGDLTPSHTAAIYQPDHEGVYREFVANEPVYKGGRVVFDPTQLFASFKTSSSSPDPLESFRCDFNDGSTWTGVFGKEHRRNITSGAVQTVAGIAVGADIDVFIGSHTALTYLDLRKNRLTGTIPDISTNTALYYFNLRENRLTGTIPDISANTALDVLDLQRNQLTGTIPDISANIALRYLDLNTNQLTGTIPDISTNTALYYFNLRENRLTGTIPDISANTALKSLDLRNNQLTGTIPDISANTALKFLDLRNNQLTGTIPDISANTALEIFYLHNNKLTDFSGGVANFTSAIAFGAAGNNLTTTAVNNLLVAFDGSTAVPGTIELSGGTNAAPTGAGLAAKSSLISKGWTVTTNA